MKTHKKNSAMCQRKKRPKIFPKANETNEKTNTEAVTTGHFFSPGDVLGYNFQYKPGHGHTDTNDETQNL